MTFDIREHIDFDAKGRAQCPVCLRDGKTGRNLSVTQGGQYDGAYKCFRGCQPNEIRAAIGVTKDRTLPPPSATENLPLPKVTVTPQKVKEATDRLLNQSTHALKWLADKGITPEMVEHYRLGVTRARCGDSTKAQGSTHLPAIAVAIPTAGGTAYFQKKRVRPWVATAEQPDGYKKWSQYGIPPQCYITHDPATPTETWLCEGEWDAIRLGWAVRNSLMKDYVQVASFTCGAGSVPPDEALASLKGEEVIVFYDIDTAGKEGAIKVQERMKSRCRIAEVPSRVQDSLPDGYDVSDALNAGIPLERFSAAAAASTVWQPPPSSNPLRERLVSNDDMIARAPDYTDWLVDDIITSDELFLLAASPRAGKSLMALTLAHAVATGGKFLGRPCSQGAVIYVRAEDSESKTKEREIKQGWGQGLPVYWLDKFKLHELDHLEELIEELGARLVVFDTLSRIRDASISESSAEMSQLLEPVQEMCKRTRCAGLLVHHTGKVNVNNAGDINVFDTIRGSSSIRATCRGVLILAADEQCYRLAVENGWGKLDLQVLLDAHSLNWRLVGNWNGPTVDLSQKDRVLAYLNQVGSAQLNQIFEAVNIPKRSLYQVLSRLQGEDLVEKRGERMAAVYVRKGIQQIQQLNSLLNSSNPDDDRDREEFNNSLQQGDPPEKVILSDGSDQKIDHFLGSPPTPHTQGFVDKSVETQAQQGIQNSTPSQHGFNTDKQSDPKTSVSEVWKHCQSLDTAVKVVKQGRKYATVYVPGVGDKRVPLVELSPLDGPRVQFAPDNPFLAQVDADVAAWRQGQPSELRSR